MTHRLVPVLGLLASVLAGGCSEPSTEGDESAGAEAQTSGTSYCSAVSSLEAGGKLEASNCGVTRGPKTDKRIAFVFTAGYFCEGGPTFLDALAAHHGKASFFMLSAAAKSTDATSKCGESLPRMVAEGHYVGPHSDTHPDVVSGQGGKTLITREKLDREIKRNTDVLRAKGVTGKMTYWMPPSETFNDEISAWSAEDGLRTVHMTECAKTRGDYLPTTASNGLYTNDAIVKRVFDCESKDAAGLNGAVLFFHLGVGAARPDADKFHHAFPSMLDKLAAEGYSFVRIDELLDPVLDPIAPTAAE